jgi:5-formyltetrahydrofolate cyclo-ligase
MHFEDKAAARNCVWRRLEADGLATYPFPAWGRIPNFQDARQAALNLFETPLLANARRIKVNPDSPQRHVRAEALRRGIVVYVPTPRLTGGFMVLDPRDIPQDQFWLAASRLNWPQFARPVGLADLPHFDVIVTGCVAVTYEGKRAGKGAGFSDLEFAILRELGHSPVPVVTTVHDVQIVGDFPVAGHDQPLSLIATPNRVISIELPLPAPSGIDWDSLPPDAQSTMPILRDLMRRQS